ncbi:hypothetical protein [Spirosoma endbachense]|uniref:Uncharacterized protein n=1 Tax=Spirosoma endbachense TaxID=2666025 RepID=A0A6P1VSL0_9BACT|nr:hypothetical protein [Spirosoma endbachense]QHV94609.1 hypothetical protein GJR95_06100 [Spirosoma endbachense]
MKLTLVEKISEEFLNFVKASNIEKSPDFSIVEAVVQDEVPAAEHRDPLVNVGKRALNRNFFRVKIEGSALGFFTYGQLYEKFYGACIQY